MITIYYDTLPCDHYTLEIKKADQDIQQHNKVGEIQRLTGSEHYIRRILQAVRSKVLRTDDVAVYYQDILMEVDIRGCFLSPWPDGLFEAGYSLLFHDYPKE
jgi:hypothetical protein